MIKVKLIDSSGNIQILPIQEKTRVIEIQRFCNRTKQSIEIIGNFKTNINKA